MEALYDLIRRFEGLRLHAYYCPAGVLTCGFGSTGPDIRPDTIWTSDQAEARMRKDASRARSSTLALCPDLCGNSLDAVADFTYNLGAGRLRASTLRRRINAGDIPGAQIELMKWVRGGGRILPGLVARRLAEVALLVG